MSKSFIPEKKEPSKLWLKTAKKTLRQHSQRTNSAPGRGKRSKAGGALKPAISQAVLKDCRDHHNLLTKEEYKVVRYSNTSGPTSLHASHCGYVPVDTKESKLLGTVLSRMFAGKVYQFRIATVLNMSSTASGTVNSAILTASLQFANDFIALSGVFNEFFLESMDIKWEPVSEYNYPLTGAIGATVSTLPLGVASLQHAQATYTNMTNMSENFEYLHTNTGRPFKYRWKNVEKKSSTVVVAPAVSGAPCQSWAMVSDVASYTGGIQFLSQAAPPGLPLSQVLGVFLAEYLVSFRVRS